jgi:NADH:ubiquinone oxidoreductase subunit K
MRNPQLVYLVTLVAWSLLVIGHLGLYLRQAFSALPTDEVYANSVGFQLVAFGLTRFPYWLVGIVAVLLVEFFIFRRR